MFTDDTYVLVTVLCFVVLLLCIRVILKLSDHEITK